MISPREYQGHRAWFIEGDGAFSRAVAKAMNGRFQDCIIPVRCPIPPPITQGHGWVSTPTGAFRMSRTHHFSDQRRQALAEEERCQRETMAAAHDVRETLIALREQKAAQEEREYQEQLKRRLRDWSA